MDLLYVNAELATSSVLFYTLVDFKSRTAAGLAAGMAISLAAGRAMRTMLFEVAPTDLRIYAAVTVVVSTVALAACYVPARRAARVDPMIALREE